MSELYAYWEHREFNDDAGRKTDNVVVRQGKLTTSHRQATQDIPVLVEEVSQRVYHASDLPPETVIYIETRPNARPELIELAKNAGFVVALASDEQIPDGIELRSEDSVTPKPKE